MDGENNERGKLKSYRSYFLIITKQTTFIVSVIIKENQKLQKQLWTTFSEWKEKNIGL